MIPEMGERPRGLHSRSTRITFGVIGIVVAGLLVCEGYLRWLHQPSEQLTSFLFHTALNVSRWQYLDHEREWLVGDILLQLDPHEDFVETPEEGRPAFDRVERPFHVRSNSLGYRDREFAWHKPDRWRRILVFGDSVAWGKGVDEERRFSSVLAGRVPDKVEVYNQAYCGFTTEIMAEQIDRSLGFAPDLLVVQAPANDLDMTLWREAEASRTLAVARLSLALASHLRTALHLRYRLFGDPYDRQIAEALATAGEFYREDLDHLFTTCRARSVPVVVVAYTLASGQAYSGHVVDACGEYGEVCLGVVEADLEHPERHIADWEAILRQRAGESDFVTRTAEQFGLDEADLAPVFPHRHLFHDTVHPNDEGHAIVAAQLEAFLAERWSGWDPVEPPPADQDQRETASSASN